jgi:hypothetical protein
MFDKARLPVNTVPSYGGHASLGQLHCSGSLSMGDGPNLWSLRRTLCGRFCASTRQAGTSVGFFAEVAMRRSA